MPLRYDRRRIIDGVSLTIPEKTTTAFVGPSGGGKTTLCHLMARFWDVQTGQVLLGGRNVKEYSFDSLMRNFSFVFQSVYLFEDTIANNIRFGEPNAPMEKVIEAAKKARCHDFILALPDGYDTVIGEGGASLSGGEKQRISIARAIMKDAPIIILDEATANVDPENETELTEAIEELTKEKTIIMIAHRLKTVRHADQIFVVDNGHIAQRGTHDELIKKDGIYPKGKAIEKIAYLIRRLRECDSFPHEIGLFLGYPAVDVKGFIEHKECKCTGLWKVFESDETEAQRYFARCRRCTEGYLRRKREGWDLSRLTIQPRQFSYN